MGARPASSAHEWCKDRRPLFDSNNARCRSHQIFSSQLWALLANLHEPATCLTLQAKQNASKKRRLEHIKLVFFPLMGGVATRRVSGRLAHATFGHLRLLRSKRPRPIAGGHGSESPRTSVASGGHRPTGSKNGGKTSEV